MPNSTCICCLPGFAILSSPIVTCSFAQHTPLSSSYRPLTRYATKLELTCLHADSSRRRHALEQQLKAEALAPEERARLLSEFERRESDFTRLQRQRITPEDFEPLTIIGRGAFGEVRIVRERSTGRTMALKKLKKSEMVRRGQVEHVRAERDVLAEVHNPYTVKLFYSFQASRFTNMISRVLRCGCLTRLLFDALLVLAEVNSPLLLCCALPCRAQ